jgi:hypothetical protein
VAKFEAGLKELQKKLAAARASLKKTRDGNPLPEEEETREEASQEAVA